jgi:hypothetical protein
VNGGVLQETAGLRILSEQILNRPFQCGVVTASLIEKGFAAGRLERERGCEQFRSLISLAGHRLPSRKAPSQIPSVNALLTE